MLVQNSSIGIKAWRGDFDLSLILSKSDSDQPSVECMIPCSRYLADYTTKGNGGTNALEDLKT